MLTAVEFDHDQRIEAREVADIKANLVLPPELETSELTTTQPAPEKSFGIGRICPQASSISAHAGSWAGEFGETMSDDTTMACIHMTPPSA